VETGYTKCKSGCINFLNFRHEAHTPHESFSCLFSHEINCAYAIARGRFPEPFSPRKSCAWLILFSTTV